MTTSLSGDTPGESADHPTVPESPPVTSALTVCAAEIDVIRWGPERARTGPWRGNGQVAYLAPMPDAPIPSADFVKRCCDVLAARGFQRIVTGALAPGEAAGFLHAGFQIEERLHLLGNDLTSVPPPPRQVRMRRAGRLDRSRVLEIDSLAFPPFWRLDGHGLDEAIRATPHARFRVSQGRIGAADGLTGYAVTGRAGRRGFLQRLAVDPAAQRAGIGRALVLDGLRWLKRWRVERAVVNTQLENEAALALYESLGFRREPAGLSVLSVGLAR